MSAPALALAVRDTIQEHLLLNGQPIGDEVCQVAFDGMPPPGCGQLFVSVHLGSWTRQEGDWDLHEQYQVSVTVTLRTGDVPTDRFGIAAWTLAHTGLDAICRKIITILHHNQQVRLRANHGAGYSIGDQGAGPDGFYTTVQFMGADPPRPQRASWFLGGEHAINEQEAALSGVSQELKFGKADRCQTIPGMT